MFFFLATARRGATKKGWLWNDGKYGSAWCAEILCKYQWHKAQNCASFRHSHWQGTIFADRKYNGGNQIEGSLLRFERLNFLSAKASASSIYQSDSNRIASDTISRDGIHTENEHRPAHFYIKSVHTCTHTLRSMSFLTISAVCSLKFSRYAIILFWKNNSSPDPS